MSVYNSEHFVRKAIDSILNQSYPDFEFIIVDDASTDQTSSILRTYQDPRIIILRNRTNRGLTVSLNAAIKVSKGQYLARQDGDDISNINRLDRQVSYMDAHNNVAVLGTTTEWIDSEDNVYYIWNQPTDHPFLQQTLFAYCCLVHGSVMCRSDVIKANQGYDTKLRTAQDYDLWLRVSEASDIACLPDVLYYYRRHNDMSSIQSKEEQDRNANKALKNAICRRDYYARQVLLSNRGALPLTISLMSRKKLAQRFVWWSSGARWVSKWLALRFFLYALMLDPTTPEIWELLRNYVSNKKDKLYK